MLLLGMSVTAIANPGEPINLLEETPFASAVISQLEEEMNPLTETVEVSPTPEEPDLSTALVSYYGKKFNGRPTASGYLFHYTDPDIVAHKSLPFGTKIEFTNPQTGATLVSTVRDRGPCHGNREFDLSEAAAKKLQFRGTGVATLDYRIVEIGNRPYPALNCKKIRNLKYG